MFGRPIGRPISSARTRCSVALGEDHPAEAGRAAGNPASTDARKRLLQMIAVVMAVSALALGLVGSMAWYRVRWVAVVCAIITVSLVIVLWATGSWPDGLAPAGAAVAFSLGTTIGHLLMKRPQVARSAA